MKGRTTIALTGAALICLCFLTYLQVSGTKPRTTLPPPASLPRLPSHNERVSIPRFDWQQVESANYKTYINNLRRIGCPKETIADIILADVNKLYLAKAAALVANSPGLIRTKVYWKTASFYRADQEIRASLKQSLTKLDQERQGVLRELLGTEGPVDLNLPSLTALLPSLSDNRLGFLPEDKQSLVQAIELEAAQRLREKVKPGQVLDRAGLILLANDETAIDQKLTQVLSADEKYHFDLREAPTAQRLRAKLDGFEPSEQEFQALFKLWKEFDSKYSPIVRPDTPEDLRERLEAERELKKTIKNVLGEPRYSDYERVQDRFYQELRAFAEESQIEAQVVIAVYETRKRAELEASAIRSNSLISQEQRGQALRRLAVDSEASLRGTLGPQRFDLYLSSQVSRYLRRLAEPEPLPAVEPITKTAVFFSDP